MLPPARPAILGGMGEREDYVEPGTDGRPPSIRDLIISTLFTLVVLAALGWIGYILWVVVTAA